MENPEYDSVNKISTPATSNSNGTDLEKKPSSNYTELIPDNARIPSHYQSLKKPNEDMGGDTYANPDNYTDVPAFTTESKKEEEGTRNLDDDESTDNGGESFEDIEYLTLEPPPPQDDREYLVPPDDQDSQN